MEKALYKSIFKHTKNWLSTQAPWNQSGRAKWYLMYNNLPRGEETTSQISSSSMCLPQQSRFNRFHSCKVYHMRYRGMSWRFIIQLLQQSPLLYSERMSISQGLLQSQNRPLGKNGTGCNSTNNNPTSLQIKEVKSAQQPWSDYLCLGLHLVVLLFIIAGAVNSSTIYYFVS